jgi:hypothetical protein
VLLQMVGVIGIFMILISSKKKYSLCKKNPYENFL